MFAYYLIIAITLLIILAALVVLFFVLWSFITLIVTRVPWAPTPKKTIDLILEEADIKPGQIVYDLGCGDGRVLLRAEKLGAKTTGFELSLWLYLKAKFKIWLSGSKTKIIRKNFLNQNLSEADIIFCFLVSKVMPKVKVKLQKDLKPDTKVISYAFTFPDWQPYKILDTKPSKTYFYEI